MGGPLSARPVRIGLTGGIGSGKSTVLQQLAGLGVPVESADAVVHRLYATASPAGQAVARLLGEAVLRADGSVNREVVRAQTFVGPDDSPADRAIKDTRRLQLMAVLDPFIWNGLLAHERNHAGAPWVVWEIPLLLEAGWVDRVDAITVIDCPRAVQVERVIARNGWTLPMVDGVLERQASREDRLAVAQDLLHGDQPRDRLALQVQQLVQTWRQRYAERP